MINNEQLAMNIKIARIRKGYTQRQMAELLGISRSRYNYYENKPRSFTVDNLSNVSALLGIQIEELLVPDNSTNCRNEKVQ